MPGPDVVETESFTPSAGAGCAVWVGVVVVVWCVLLQFKARSHSSVGFFAYNED